MHDADWKCGKLWRMSFIHVKPSGERDDIPSTQLSGNYGTSMTNHCRGGKSGNIGERHPHRILDITC
jgi:hypothetical protein